ncbi:hypothetical protein QTO34_014154 [Cnephaeus nilssonii]|uniref:Uncharacterized protein n=1 Tax=Cnephaeus nilssonii TaxID=3371016 RepID=A0AA40HAZ7_CNENI|nr:hypothetical protein QTO34_014154 [Eptesicus nilssonii]
MHVILGQVSSERQKLQKVLEILGQVSPERQNLQKVLEILGPVSPERQNLQMVLEILGQVSPERQNLQKVLEILGQVSLQRQNLQKVLEILGQVSPERQNLQKVLEILVQELKKALISAPALALPDVTKPFHLHRLDPVAAGWPACLRAVATTALLVKEADKQILGQELALTTPHAVEALLRGAPERWMSNTKIIQCQALLLDQPCVRFHKTLAINPASLLPDDDPEEPIHDCTEVTDAVQMPCPDLTDAPLSSPDKVLFTVGSIYVQDGIRYAEQR